MPSHERPRSQPDETHTETPPAGEGRPSAAEMFKLLRRRTQEDHPDVLPYLDRVYAGEELEMSDEEIARMFTQEQQNILTQGYHLGNAARSEMPEQESPEARAEDIAEPPPGKNTPERPSMTPDEIFDEWVNNSFHYVRTGGGLPEEQRIVNSDAPDDEKRRLLKEFHARRMNEERAAETEARGDSQREESVPEAPGAHAEEHATDAVETPKFDVNLNQFDETKEGVAGEEMHPAPEGKLTESEARERLDAARTAYARLAIIEDRRAKKRVEKRSENRERSEIIGEGSAHIRINLLREDLTPMEGMEEARARYRVAVDNLRSILLKEARDSMRVDMTRVRDGRPIRDEKEGQAYIEKLIHEDIFREGIALADEKTRLRLTPERGFLHPDTAWKFIQKCGEWYINLDTGHRDTTKSRLHWRNLPYKKLAISLGLFVASAGAGLGGITAAGAIVGGARIIQRILGGAATGVAAEAFIKNRFDRLREKRVFRGLENAQENLANLSLDLNDILGDINETLDERILAFEQDAASRRRSERILARAGGIAAGAIVGGGYAARGVRGGMGYLSELTGITPESIARRLGASRDILARFVPRRRDYFRSDYTETPTPSRDRADMAGPKATQPTGRTKENMRGSPTDTSPKTNEGARATKEQTPAVKPNNAGGEKTPPETKPDSEKPKASRTVSRASAEGITTIRKDEGAWQAVRRQYYERIKIDPAKYGMTADEARKLPELDKLGKGTKAARILNRETLATLKRAGYINPDGTTRLGIARPGTQIILNPDNTVSNGKLTYEFGGKKPEAIHAGARGKGISQGPHSSAMTPETSRRPQLMDARDDAATPAPSPHEAYAANLKANMAEYGLKPQEAKLIEQAPAKTFIDEMGRHATEIKEYRTHGGRVPDIFINRGPLTGRGFRADLPQAEKYVNLSERLERHLKTLRAADRQRLLRKPVGDILRTVSLNKQ